MITGSSYASDHSLKKEVYTVSTYSIVNTRQKSLSLKNMIRKFIWVATTV